VPKRIAQSKTARKKDHEGIEALSPQDSRLRLVEPPPGASTVEAQIRELEQEIRGASHRPVSDLLADWVHRLRVLTEADGAVVAMRDAKGIVCHASSGQAPEVGSRLQPDSSLTRECFENGRLVICEDVESDPRIPSLIAKTLNLRSALIVPIKANQSVFGVVEVLSSRPSAFDPGTVAAVQAIAVPLARLLCPKPASQALNPRRWFAVAVLIACLLLLFIALRVYRSTSNRRSAVLARPASGPSPSGQRSTDPSSESRTSSALRVPPTTATASNNPRDAGSHRLAKPSPGQSTSVAAITAVQRNSSPGKEISREESPASVVKLEAPELSNLLSPARAPVLAGSPTLPPPPIVKNLPRSEFVLNRTLKAHSSWVTGLAFSPDGGRLASGSWDHHVKFWDVTSGQELGGVVGKVKEVQALALSRDGRWLAAEDLGNAVTLWDAASGREVHTLAGDKSFNLFDRSWVYSIAFSPDGRSLAAALDDKIGPWGFDSPSRHHPSKPRRTRASAMLPLENWRQPNASAMVL